jgi:hypothetical protein
MAQEISIKDGLHYKCKFIFSYCQNRLNQELLRACAYGIDALVDKLVQAGADVNASNCYGYSCLLEACHRGYAEIVKFLLRSPHIHVNYIPSEHDAMNSPFSSSPPQTALGEASRCGYFKIVQMLIDAGANKEAKNMFGWTALHEACFYHRLETVKTLLLAGADATARTNLGALPYHLAGLTEIRNMLESMGGASAVPKEGDTIDMVKVLTELTTGSAAMDEDEGDSGKGGYATMVLTPNGPMVVFSSSSPTSSAAQANSSRPAITNEVKQTPSSDDSTRAVGAHSHDHHDHESKATETVPSSSSSAQKASKQKDSNYTDPTISSTNKSPSKRADSKHKSSSQTPLKETVPADMPKQYICELTQKPMSEPMRTVYGNVYEKTAISQWFKQQGHICPLTGILCLTFSNRMLKIELFLEIGAPLSETDLTALPDLGNEIRTWILKKSLAENDSTASPSSSPIKNKSPDAKKQPPPKTPTATDDDLYDF